MARYSAVGAMCDIKSKRTLWVAMRLLISWPSSWEITLDYLRILGIGEGGGLESEGDWASLTRSGDATVVDLKKQEEEKRILPVSLQRGVQPPHAAGSL